MPRVLEDLTEDERYLYALLQDHSGVDIAEFLWVDETSADSVYRCWDYQIPWYRCEERFQIDQCARSIGKSEGIQMRAFAFAFTNPGEQLFLTAPEMVHLDPTTKKVEQRLLGSRITREMLKRSGNSNGIRHKPFEVEFVNGAQIISRIPQKDGKGVKGMHPKKLELDEAQDFPESGWVELGETLKFANVDATWRAHGVSKGMHDRYYKATQDSNWFVHRLTAMHRPDWTQEEREAKAEFYGSREHPDYRRNILGLHGDLTNPLFVLHRLMACVDINEASAYNQIEYYKVDINDNRLQDYGGDITGLLDFPAMHSSYSKVWVGMDIGLTDSPSVVLIFAEEPIKDQTGQPRMRLKLIGKITLRQISAPDQRKVLGAINDFYKPQRIAIDSTGMGLPIFQEIVENIEDRALSSVIKGFNFSEKIIVGWDMSDPDFQYDPDDPDENAIKAPVLEYSTDILREQVDLGAKFGTFQMPNDDQLIKEFSGTTYVNVKSATKQNPYGKQVFSKNGGLHTLDAARMAILGWKQNDVDAMLKWVEDQEPVLDYFLV